MVADALRLSRILLVVAALPVVTILLLAIVHGPSLFYRARGRYSLLRTCNHWVSDVLAAAGVPSSPVPSTLAIGLMAELRWRMTIGR